MQMNAWRIDFRASRIFVTPLSLKAEFESGSRIETAVYRIVWQDAQLMSPWTVISIRMISQSAN
jgi:hypothetical protein